MDFVLEKNGALVALEVKAAQQVSAADAAGIEAFRRSLRDGRRFRRGGVLNAGPARPLGDRLFALPWGWLVPREKKNRRT